ncbi:UNVERIFIED_CONTAM: hypothetical protein GTU68_007997 [Idotea baltica]|nr:hypothetical protein [Idotea baltica]
MSLGVNLALNKRNAQLICEGAGLKLILKRAFKNRDPLLMKMVRNIAQHEGPTRALFTDYVSDLCGVVIEGTCDEFVLECVGVLGNLALPDLDFSHILTEFNFLNWIVNNLRTDVADDLVLEVVVLVGTVAADEAAAKLLVQAGILDTLVNLLNAKQEDDEVVLQIVYVFYQLTRHESTRPRVVMTAEVPAYLIDLMHDNNNEIRKVCDATLDIIAEEDSEVGQPASSAYQFRWYNQSMVGHGGGWPFGTWTLPAGEMEDGGRGGQPRPTLISTIPESCRLPGGCIRTGLVPRHRGAEITLRLTASATPYAILRATQTDQR